MSFGTLDMSNGMSGAIKKLFENSMEREGQSIKTRPKYESEKEEKIHAFSHAQGYISTLKSMDPNTSAYLDLPQYLGFVCKIGEHDFPRSGLSDAAKNVFDAIYKDCKDMEDKIKKGEIDKFAGYELDLSTKYYNGIEEMEKILNEIVEEHDFV